MQLGPDLGGMRELGRCAEEVGFDPGGNRQPLLDF